MIEFAVVVGPLVLVWSGRGILGGVLLESWRVKADP